MSSETKFNKVALIISIIIGIIIILYSFYLCCYLCKKKVNRVEITHNIIL